MITAFAAAGATLVAITVLAALCQWGAGRRERAVARRVDAHMGEARADCDRIVAARFDLEFDRIVAHGWGADL